MSLLMTVHVRRHKNRDIPVEKNFAYSSAAAIMDIPDFAGIRDYYIREFASEYAIKRLHMNKNKEDMKNAVSKEALYGKIPDGSAEDRLNAFLNSSLFDGTGRFNGRASKETRSEFEELVKDKFIEINSDTSITPYERVGKMMRLFIGAADKFDKSRLRISHVYMRRWMTEQLSHLCCQELARHPEQAAWPVLPSKIMSETTRTLEEMSPNAPLPVAFPPRSASGERAISHRNGLFYENYPKPAEEFRHEASVRNEVLNKLTPGQNLLFTPWMENGFQMNAFSWRNFENFIHRYYVMTATESTFDKSFFCEWVVFGGNRWSKPEYKKKYDEVWDAAYQEWVEIAKVVIPSVPKLALSNRMTSLPKQVQQTIAVDALNRWPGLAGSRALLQIVAPVRAKDPAIDKKVTVAENLVNVRESLGLINTARSPTDVVDDKFRVNAGSVEWSIHEHLEIRSTVVEKNKSVSLPDVLFTDDTFTNRSD